MRNPKVSGETRLLLDVACGKGWKTYRRSPGEGGVAPAIKWHQPVEAIWRWLVLQRFDVAGITTQGYHVWMSVFPSPQGATS